MFEEIHPKRSTTVAEDQAEAAVRQRWGTDQHLRTEFGDNLKAACAYARAEARGAVKFCGKVKRYSAADMQGQEREHSGGGFVDAGASYQRAAYTPSLPEGATEDEVRRTLKRRWDSDAHLRAEFADEFNVYAAYEQAMRDGRVKIFGQRAQGRREAAGTAATPGVAPVVASPSAPMARQPRAAVPYPHDRGHYRVYNVEGLGRIRVVTKPGALPFIAVPGLGNVAYGGAPDDADPRDPNTFEALKRWNQMAAMQGAA
jgi:hypothetical protein